MTSPDCAQSELEFLFGRLNYERQARMPYGATALKLSRMERLLEKLGHPHRGFPVVHVAGTKGKGSTATMIAAVLRAAGYRCGLYTSPHLRRVEERIVVDGQSCSSAEFLGWLRQVRPHAEQMDREDPSQHGPTFFEIVTAIAFLAFRQERADIGVMEVGLGGRLDSTNVCESILSVITSISFDHMLQLGNTLAKIAGEKAGILRPGVPAISGVTEDEPGDVIRQVAQQVGTSLWQLDRDFSYHYQDNSQEAHPTTARDFVEAIHPQLTFHLHVAGREPIRWDAIVLGLLGQHQGANAAVALAAVARLRELNWNIPDQAIYAGIHAARCPARIEPVATRPMVIIDVGHNPAAIDALMDVLRKLPVHGRRHLIFATTHGKDVHGMLAALFEGFDEIYLTRYCENPRTVPCEELCEISAAIEQQRRAAGMRVAQWRAHAHPLDAWQSARRVAGSDDLICITGSFFLAAELWDVARASASPERAASRSIIDSQTGP